MIYLCTVERRTGASGIGDPEGVLGEGAQNSTRVIKEFEGLVSGVGDGRGDLQVPQSIDLAAEGRSLDRQARASGDDDCRGDESNEGTTDGRGEHRGEGFEGGWRGSSNETWEITNMA